MPMNHNNYPRAIERYTAWPTGEQDVVRARIARHRELDEITQGFGYEQGWDSERPERVRACAVGCSLDRYDHAEYSRVLGVDLRVAKLVDLIHESLPIVDAVDWPGRVTAPETLVPGADTTFVADRFLIWALRQGRCGLDEHCARVAALYGDRMLGREPAVDTWRQASAADYAAAAANAAYAAYAAYAYADYAAASTSASISASYAAAAASTSASYAAYAASAASYAAAAKVAFWRGAASALIELLSRCEVVS